MNKNMTKQELVAMTIDETVRHEHELMMEAGVPLVSPPSAGDEPQKPMPVTSMTMYEIKGLLFTDRAVALQVLEAIQNAGPLRDVYEYVGYEHINYATDELQNVEIETRRACAKEEKAAYKARVKEYERAKDEWMAANKAYSEWMGAVDDALGQFREDLEVARDAHRRVEYLAGCFVTYVNEADGDKEMAWRFFIKAYPEAASNDWLVEMVGRDEWNNTEGIKC